LLNLNIQLAEIDIQMAIFLYENGKFDSVGRTCTVIDKKYLFLEYLKSFW